MVICEHVSDLVHSEEMHFLFPDLVLIYRVLKLPHHWAHAFCAATVSTIWGRQITNLHWILAMQGVGFFTLLSITLGVYPSSPWGKISETISKRHKLLQEKCPTISLSSNNTLAWNGHVPPLPGLPQQLRPGHGVQAHFPHSVLEPCPYLAEAFQPQTWPPQTLLHYNLLRRLNLRIWPDIYSAKCRMHSADTPSTHSPFILVYCSFVPVFPVFWVPRTRSLTGAIVLRGRWAPHGNTWCGCESEK